MTITQLGVQISNDLRLGLYLMSDGEKFNSVLITQMHGFDTLFDYDPEGITGIFDKSGFTLMEKGDKEGNNYSYDTPYPYKEMPILKAWLIQQNLLWPN